MAEEALYKAVVLQAFLDMHNTSKKRERLNEKYSASKWLMDAGEDFKFICILAGLEPSYVHNKVKEKKDGLNHRADNGKGIRYFYMKKRRTDKLNMKT